MIETNVYCDHCKQLIPKQENSPIRPNVYIEYYLEMDLCPKCKKELQDCVNKFLYGGRNDGISDNRIQN